MRDVGEGLGCYGLGSIMASERGFYLAEFQSLASNRNFGSLEACV